MKVHMIRPIKSNILVSELKQDKPATSIILTTKDNTDTVYAKVLAVGPLVENVSVDDVIIIDWSKTTPVDNLTKGIINEEYVIAIMDE